MAALKLWVATLLLIFASTPSRPSIEADIDCLAKTIYHEARGEPLTGKIAVAWVVVNRVRSNGFPSSVCKVVDQPGQFPWRRKPHQQSDLTSYQESVKLANEVMNDLHPDPTDGSVYFQNVRRVGHGVFSTKIGSHYFFKQKSPK